MDDVGFELVKNFQVKSFVQMFGLPLLFGEALSLQLLSFVFEPSAYFFLLKAKTRSCLTFLMDWARKRVESFGSFFGSKKTIHPAVEVSQC